MNLKLFWTVFASIFIAELGDKTQLATLLYAADRERSRWVVFAASASALVFSSGLGVLAGSLVSATLDPQWLHWIAGAGFVAVGLWVLLSPVSA
jgi:putative Ca2+/H+ antiporter (TMEM165/GDT1 family)